MKRVPAGIPVEDLPILGRSDECDLFKRILGNYDAPAYIRRARRVQEALDQLVGRCRRQRDEWLPLVRTRLALLRARAGDWDRLLPHLASQEEIAILHLLEQELAPRLRVRAAPTMSPRLLRDALGQLIESIERFNRRWNTFVFAVDLTPVNFLREDYNRYFLIEKECAVRSARIARQGYQPLALLTLDDLKQLLPPLPVPRVRAAPDSAIE